MIITNHVDSKVNHIGATRRQKLRLKMIDASSHVEDSELLEMILYTVIGRDDARPIINRLISKFSSFAHVISAPTEVLLDIPQITRAHVAAIKTISLAARRLASADFPVGKQLNDWSKLHQYLQIELGREKTEQCRILFLDIRYRLIANELYAEGAHDSVSFDTRRLAKRSLMLEASSLVIVHNHPSGDPTPSKNDIQFANALREAFCGIRIVILDFIIVGNGKCVSFREKGYL